MYIWGMLIDININYIFMGPFYEEKNVTGLGEKFTMKKRADEILGKTSYQRTNSQQNRHYERINASFCVNFFKV